ncbi:hypothetical protein Dimus_024313 [Dionaea muscipula]
MPSNQGSKCRPCLVNRFIVRLKYFSPHKVKDELVPKINQQFDCLDDVQQFYNTYAKESGFGTRSSSSRKNREDVIMRKEFCCSKEGVGLEIMTE